MLLPTCACLVLTDRVLGGHLALALDGVAVLSDEDGLVVALVEVVEVLAEAPGDVAEPVEVRLGAEERAVSGLEEEEGVAVALVIGASLDEVGGVEVAAVEVGRVLEQLLLLGSEDGEALLEHGLHRLGVVTEVDGVGEPSNGNVHLVLGGLDV
jgi:hypothetical protein